MTQGKAIAKLVVSGRLTRSTSAEDHQLQILTCQYPVSKRVVPAKPPATDEREKLDDATVNQQQQQHKIHSFWPNNVESDTLSVNGVDKRVDLVAPPPPARDPPSTVFLNRDSFARSVSVNMTPDPQILALLRRRRQHAHELAGATDDTGFLRVSRRISVKVPDSLATKL